MTSNETVAEIVQEMREMPQEWIVDANANFVFARYADRIKAANKREIAAKDAEIEELIGIINRECNKCRECIKFQTCLKSEYTTADSRGCPRFVSKREAAKDAEIAELRECLREAIHSSCVKCTLYNSRRVQCSYSSGVCGDVAKWRKALEGGTYETK